MDFYIQSCGWKCLGTGSGPFRFARTIATKMAMVHALDLGSCSQICTRVSKGELPFRESDGLNGLQAGDCDGQCS